MGDDEQSRRDLPLITYPAGNRELVLQRASFAVVFDHDTSQLQLVNADDVEPAVCPTCHRPYEDEAHEDTQWMSPDYFRLLNRSRQGSVHSSESDSPQRLLPAVRSTSAHFAPRVASVEAAGEDVDGSETLPASSSSPKISSTAFSPGYFEQHFVEVRELGHGGSGVVLQVKHVLEGHDVGQLACKRIPIGDDLPWLTKVLAEVKLLQRLRHPNLVAYMHVWLEHFQPSNFAPSIPHAYILQQYCNGGDLQNYLFHEVDGDILTHKLRTRSMLREAKQLGSARRMPFDQVRAFFKDITAGLKYLHSNGLVHRDLKPSNCLLHRTEKRLTVLVSDFGETTEENAVRKSSGATGTVSYCAPEVLIKDSRTGRFGNFTQKSDIFSLGLIVHLMCFGKLPFTHADPMNEENEDYDRLREEIASWQGLTNERGSRPDVSDRMREDLSRLLSLKPEERPSSEDILRALKANPNIYDNGSRTSSGSRRGSMVADERDSAEYRMPAVEDEPHSPNSASFESTFEPMAQDDRYPLSESTAVVRRRRLQSPPRPFDAPKPAKEPYLLLPPPQSRVSRIVSVATGPAFTALAKLLIFGIKMWTILAPCRPLAVELRAAYPLLGLAAADLTGLFRSTWASLLLAAVHVALLRLMSQRHVLCDFGTPEPPTVEV